MGSLSDRWWTHRGWAEWEFSTVKWRGAVKRSAMSGVVFFLVLWRQVNALIRSEGNNFRGITEWLLWGIECLHSNWILKHFCSTGCLMFFQLSFHFCRSKVLDNKNDENQPLFMSFGRKDFYWGVPTCMHVSVFWVRSLSWWLCSRYGLSHVSHPVQQLSYALCWQSTHDAHSFRRISLTHFIQTLM